MFDLDLESVVLQLHRGHWTSRLSWRMEQYPTRRSLLHRGQQKVHLIGPGSTRIVPAVKEPGAHIKQRGSTCKRRFADYIMFIHTPLLLFVMIGCDSVNYNVFSDSVVICMTLSQSCAGS